MRLRQDHGLKGPGRPKRDQHGKGFVLQHQPLARGQLLRQVPAQKALPLLVQVHGLTAILQGGIQRHAARGPYLAVGMRIGATHDRAPVLENLNVTDVVPPAQSTEFIAPDIDHGGGPVHAQAGHGEIMAGGIADNPADARFRLGHQQAVRLGRAFGRFRHQCGKIVGKDKGSIIVGIDRAARPLVAGAQIAGRVVPRQHGTVRFLLLPLPRSLGAMRRHQHPLAGELIEPPVRMIVKKHAFPRVEDSETSPGKVGSTTRPTFLRLPETQPQTLPQTFATPVCNNITPRKICQDGTGNMPSTLLLWAKQEEEAAIFNSTDNFFAQPRVATVTEREAATKSVPTWRHHRWSGTGAPTCPRNELPYRWFPRTGNSRQPRP